MTLTELENLCRESWTAEGLSDKTIHAYLLVIRRAEAVLDRRGATVLTATALEIRELAVSWPRTRSSRVQLRTALARAWEAADRADGPIAAVTVPSKPRYGSRALEDPQASALAKVARGDTSSAGLAVLLGLYAGLRREEIAKLRFDEIRDGWLRFVGKGDITRDVPVHPELAGRLERRRAASVSPFVFPGDVDGHVNPTTVWTWTRRLGRIAIDVAVPPHVLRHTAIATMNDITRDLRAAQHFAGHASPETTVIYTRVSRQRLVDAVSAITYDEGEGA
jgi:integrase/recombinase XerC